MSDYFFEVCERCLCSTCNNSYAPCGYSYCNDCLQKMRNGQEGSPVIGKCDFHGYNPINKWINPTKELPPKEIDVLILFKDENGYYRYELRYMDEYDTGMKFDCDMDINSIPLHRIIAWLPLPEPPKWIINDEN